MRRRQMHGKPTLLLATAVLGLVLAQAGPALAGPLDDPGVKGVVRFAPAPALPPVVEGRLDGVASAVHVAPAPLGMVYAATDRTGKARVWLVRNNALVAELTVPASQEHMLADWPGSFVVGLGALPVIAISWRLGKDAYGVEDYAFWALDGRGRFLGGLPGSSRSACSATESAPGKDCGRCGAANGIPIDLKLRAVAADRVHLTQFRAAAWYFYFSAAAEIFEQDFVLSATGLVPDGVARRTRNVMPVPQVKERIKGLLRDYFRLAKTQGRPEIAPEFLTCFQQSVELSPDFGQGYYNVACMHALLGNRSAAIEAITKSLSLEPSYRKLARKDPDLASIRDDADVARLLGEPAK